MASGIYDRFKANLMNKIVDLEADTIKVALLTSDHSLTVGNNVWGQVSGNQITGTGYTAGGVTITNPGVSQNATTVWDADNVSWVTASFTAAHAVIWDDTVATDDLVCSFDFGGNKTVSSGTFTIQWNASGIITLS